MTQQERWTAADQYFAERLLEADPALDDALAARAAAGLPPHQVTPAEGRLLHILARAAGARRILEIGTLGGYSTICLARALPPRDGRLVTLELSEHHAAVARRNIDRAGLAGLVDVIVGPAIETLPRLAAEARGPFDLIFLDADKAGSADYFEWSLKMSRPGTVIIFDNVVREGAVTDPDTTDPSVQGIQRLMDMLSAEPRIAATAIQTVGAKGWDGFAVALVTAEAAAER